MEYEFTLKFKLPSTTTDVDKMVERLAEAGCEDALVGIGVPGRVGLKFTREADSAHAAVISAIQNVKSAIPDAQLIEASPDFVGITDVADLMGVSRQNIRKLIISNTSSFPSAVHEGNSAIWHLAHVLQWFQGRGLYEKAVKGLVEIARTAMEVNVAKEAKRLPLTNYGELETLVA